MPKKIFTCDNNPDRSLKLRNFIAHFPAEVDGAIAIFYKFNRPNFTRRGRVYTTDFDDRGVEGRRNVAENDLTLIVECPDESGYPYSQVKILDYNHTRAGLYSKLAEGYVLKQIIFRDGAHTGDLFTNERARDRRPNQRRGRPRRESGRDRNRDRDRKQKNQVFHDPEFFPPIKR